MRVTDQDSVGSMVGKRMERRMTLQTISVSEAEIQRPLQCYACPFVLASFGRAHRLIKRNIIAVHACGVGGVQMRARLVAMPGLGERAAKKIKGPAIVGVPR